MKKTFWIFLIVIACFFTSLKAQNYNFSDKIKWNDIQKIKLDSATYIERLAFEGAVYYDQEEIPVYFHQLKKKNIDVIGFSWENFEVKPLSEKEKILIKQHDVKLPDQFKLTINRSVIRKTQNTHINIVPLRISPETGEPEKLTQFSINIRYENIPVYKSQRQYADNSVLKTGEWYKIRVASSGMYKLPYSVISSMGFNNPAQVGVFGYGGMVPKKNAVSRYDDIPQRPVYLQDNNGNGTFDSGDAYLVYLEGPNSHEYKGEGVYEHDIHNYSDYAYYFLSDANGALFVESASETLTPNKFTNAYDYYGTLEKDSVNLIKSGRQWFWRHFNYYPSYTFNMSIPSVDNSESAILYTSLAARSQQTSRFKITINGNSTYSDYINAISGSSTDYYAKITEEQISFTPQTSNVIKIEYLFPNTGSEGWLDYLTINARAWLSLQGNSLRFRDSRTVGSGNVTQYSIKGVNSNCVVLDITNPVNAYEIVPDQLAGGQMKFTAESNELHEYIVFDVNASYSTPQIDGSEKLGYVSNQNLHGYSNVDYVIVTNSLFTEYANQLAEFHQSLHGLNTIVVDQEEIFNEFSSGTPDVAAIRDFMKMLYDKAASESDMPKYLLLFGDGSYDNKKTTSPNTNYILTYQSDNGLHPTMSFVSDDFFGLLDDNEGTVSGSEGIDVGIGRLPVKSQAEAENVVEKIFSYVQPDSFGSWRNIICFIGDDEDSNSHQMQADEMGDTIMEHFPEFNARKILLDAYEQISTVQGERYPAVNQAIDERVEKGALIINYSGHGNENSLAHEAVVTLSQINSWNNLNRLPLFLTATCEFSRFDDYEFTSAGEQILLNPEGGGIGLLTTSRMVYSGSNFTLNQEFYRQVFKRDENHELYALGENIMHTKNNAGDSNNKRNFVLLGDPALKLAIPHYVVKTDSVNGMDVSVFTDTAAAASHISVSGHIEDRAGNIMTDYNGILYSTVFDKVMEYTTMGNDDDPPYPYKEQKNILYAGKASIKNGYFSFEFIVPVDIAYYFDNGKISYYAESDNSDAHGFFDQLIIGGSSDNMANDVWGPDIELYMNNTDFVDGGITDESPDMLAFVYDESGINTVGNGIGHDIVAVLDNNTADAIILNDFYEADLDSYQSGIVTYPFQNLDAGMHNLHLKVWDVFNNSAETEISFMVANSSELVIE
ncbi:MAG: type IX secretion system sortase PorU, partial [Bacteroidales bacterium]